MKLNIQKWGNGAAVRFPSVLLAQIGAKIGDAFEIEVASGSITLRPSRPTYSLDALIAEMPDGFPIDEAWESMPAVGQELD